MTHNKTGLQLVQLSHKFTIVSHCLRRELLLGSSTSFATPSKIKLWRQQDDIQDDIQEAPTTSNFFY
jgi:hypothetical protein